MNTNEIMSDAIKSIIRLVEVSKQCGYKDNLQLILHAVSKGIDIDNILKYLPPNTSIEKSNKIIDALLLDYPEELINTIVKYDIPNLQIQLFFQYPEYNYALINKVFSPKLLLNMAHIFSIYKTDYQKEFIHYSLKDENIYSYEDLDSYKFLDVKIKWSAIKTKEEINKIIIKCKELLGIYDDIDYKYDDINDHLIIIIPYRYHLRIKHLKLESKDIFQAKLIKRISFQIVPKEEPNIIIYEPFTYDIKTKWKAVMSEDREFPSNFKRYIERKTEISGQEITPKEFDDLAKYYECTPNIKMSSIIDSYREYIENNLSSCDYLIDIHSSLDRNHNDDEINHILKEFGY